MLSSMEIRKSSRLKVQSLSKKQSEKWRLVCHLLTMPSVVGSWNSSYLWGINTILFIFWAPQPFHYWFAVRWPIHSTLVPLCAYLIHQHACYILKKVVSWYLISHGNQLCVNLVCTASLCSTHQNLVKCNHTSCADEGISVFVLFNGYHKLHVFPFWRMAHCISVVKICPVILLQWYTTQYYQSLEMLIKI